MPSDSVCGRRLRTQRIILLKSLSTRTLNLWDELRDFCLSLSVLPVDRPSSRMLAQLGPRSRSLFPSSTPGGWTQAVTEPADFVDLSQMFVKPWNSMQVRRHVSLSVSDLQGGLLWLRRTVGCPQRMSVNCEP